MSAFFDEPSTSPSLRLERVVNESVKGPSQQVREGQFFFLFLAASIHKNARPVARPLSSSLEGQRKSLCVPALRGCEIRGEGHGLLQSCVREAGEGRTV